MPGRIRINSHPLLAVLSHIAAKDWSMRPRVLLKPYKLLVHFESEIREYLKKLEDKWAHADITQLHERGALEAAHSSTQTDHKISVCAEEKENGADVHPELGNNIGAVSYVVTGGVTTERKTIEEKQPTDFEDILESYEALADLRCLVRFMNRYLSPVLKRFGNASLKKIEFEDLWYLFKPGDEVYAPAPKARRPNRYQTAWRVLFVGGGRPALTADEETKRLLESRPHDFVLTCYYLDYNGRQYGPTCCNFIIKPFEGPIDITSLEVYPWRFAKKGPAIREKLRSEGELFREYVNIKHLTYDGTSLTHHPCGRPLLVPGAPTHPEGIEGQVIVGFEEGVQIDPGWLAPIGFPDEMNVFSSEVIESYPNRLWMNRDQLTSTDSWTDIIHSDVSIDKQRYTELVESDPFLRAWESLYFNENDVGNGVLRDEDLILLPTRVLAYVFRERKFALLNLRSLRTCRVDLDGFRNLKLPPGYKEMVKSLVMTHFMKKKASTTWGGNDTMDFDVVYGKSRGLIILLHGVPGVGKTSTAECVAEATGKPLFPITCGDLGLTPEHVEKTLRDTFHLAQLWDCVLLLDEADIFLAQRNRTDLQRNALVSVFLRVLEYYSGILFLTTNRVGVIDEAFKSRIHVPLLYPELTERQTKAIWRMNLDRLRKIDKERAERSHDPEMIIDETAIMEFQKRHFQECRENRSVWNGRQIRNAFQTASALALFDAHQANINRFDEQADVEKAAPVLKVEYFEKVDKASRDFDLYISETAGVGGKSAAERARDRGERADHLKFYGNKPLESQTQLRSPNPRRTSFGHDSSLRHPGPNPQYSSTHVHRTHDPVYGTSLRAAAQFNSSSATLFDPRHTGSNISIYEHAQSPALGSENPICHDAAPSGTPHTIRREAYNEYDYDGED
ncbi:P-loop containing nucleoside triphosphate hydrolase protein [Glonium stellatum]|uniref:P-loop containing nucleoside triphosphate hydrolase protein n=1 Tax=Glonium stellatum TaxID=574774 RepID=A0A8E2F299_9PEZI|nr:P-loop containing nucleoside triphosphate hydrolase protein [Glonium stellatum]